MKPSTISTQRQHGRLRSALNWKMTKWFGISKTEAATT